MKLYFKMRQTYTPSRASESLYRTALNNDLGIYHVQSGAGIGGFFKSMFRKIVPIGKSLLKQGFDLVKPELQKLASKGIEAAGNYSTKQLQRGIDGAHKRIGTKRKKDILS